MNKKSPAEMEAFKTTKTYRTLIRLKYSLQADEELNDILPDRLRKFNDALQQGELLSIDSGLQEVIDALDS